MEMKRFSSANPIDTRSAVSIMKHNEDDADSDESESIWRTSSAKSTHLEVIDQQNRYSIDPFEKKIKFRPDHHYVSPSFSNQLVTIFDQFHIPTSIREIISRDYMAYHTISSLFCIPKFHGFKDVHVDNEDDDEHEYYSPDGEEYDNNEDKLWI